MAEWSIASDCKSDASRLRRFKSYSPQVNTLPGPLAHFGRASRLAGRVNDSNPNKKKQKISLPIYGPLAHFGRAPALHAGGEGFESPRVQMYNLYTKQQYGMICLCAEAQKW